jgi:hypothetical protein
MPDPISVASFALSLIKTAGEQLNKLRERAQATKDLEIKEHVGNLYDTMNALKEAFSRLSDENRELKQRLEAQKQPPEVPDRKQVGEANYYYLKNGDGGFDGPYCQPCYDDKTKLVALTPQQRDDDGTFRRCLVCKQTFYEQRVDERSAGGWFGGGGNPDSWMR